MAKNNPRYDCSGCKQRNTRNQLKLSNGVCGNCKTPMPHSAWLGGQAGTVCQLFSLSKGDEVLLQAIADGAGVNITDLIRAAVQNRLTAWEMAPDSMKEARNDIILGKLAQR